MTDTLDTDYKVSSEQKGLNLWTSRKFYEWMKIIHIFKEDIKSNKQEYLEGVVRVVGAPNEMRRLKFELDRAWEHRVVRHVNI